MLPPVVAHIEFSRSAVPEQEPCKTGDQRATCGCLQKPFAASHLVSRGLGWYEWSNICTAYVLHIVAWYWGPSQACYHFTAAAGGIHIVRDTYSAMCIPPEPRVSRTRTFDALYLFFTGAYDCVIRL
jgi:hypothetical protein